MINPILLFFQGWIYACLATQQNYLTGTYQPLQTVNNITNQCIYLGDSKQHYYQVNWYQNNMYIEAYDPECSQSTITEVIYTGQARLHSLPAITVIPTKSILLTWREIDNSEYPGLVTTKLLSLQLNIGKKEYNNTRRHLLGNNSFFLAKETEPLSVKAFLSDWILYEEDSFSLVIAASNYFTSSQNETIYLGRFRSSHFCINILKNTI